MPVRPRQEIQTLPILRAPAKLAAAINTGPPGRSIADVLATRKAIYTGVLDSFKGLGPVQAGNYTTSESRNPVTRVAPEVATVLACSEGE